MDDKDLLKLCSELLEHAQSGFIIDCDESLEWEKKKQEVMRRIKVRLTNNMFGGPEVQ